MAKAKEEVKRVKFKLNNGFETEYDEKVAKIFEARGHGQIVGQTGKTEGENTPAGNGGTVDLEAMNKEELHAYGLKLGLELGHITSVNKPDLKAMIEAKLA